MNSLAYLSHLHQMVIRFEEIRQVQPVPMSFIKIKHKIGDRPIHHLFIKMGF